MPSLIAALPETNLQVMEQLQTYRFLTPSQMLRLEVASHPKSLQRALRRFDTRRKCVDFAEFGVFPKVGRLPRVYFLTKYGAEYLADACRVAPETIHYPKGTRLFRRDYFHRTATIDFEIELQRFTERFGATVEFFDRYFDTEGANRNADPADRLRCLSKVPLAESFFIPDGIFAVTAPDRSRYLYALEVYNGIDTKRVHRKLRNHLLALGEGRLSEQYRYPKAHRVLCVFETDSALQAAEKRLRTDPAFSAPMLNQFAFGTLAALRADFVTGWRFLVPGRTCIFDPHP